MKTFKIISLLNKFQRSIETLFNKLYNLQNKVCIKEHTL